MKKSIATKTASVSHTVLAQTQPAGVTDPIPTTLAPSPPPGYVATKIGRGRNNFLRSQVAIASKVAGEITSSTTYAKFGTAVPDQASVASALSNAAAWSGVVRNVSVWYAYAKQQEAAAWKHATGLTDTLQVPFEYHLGRDATLEKEFPSLISFYAGPKARAQKSAATRKQNAAGKGATNKGSVAAAQPAVAEAPANPAPGAPAAKLLN